MGIFRNLLELWIFPYAVKSVWFWIFCQIFRLYCVISNLEFWPFSEDDVFSRRSVLLSSIVTSPKSLRLQGSPVHWMIFLNMRIFSHYFNLLCKNFYYYIIFLFFFIFFFAPLTTLFGPLLISPCRIFLPSTALLISIHCIMSQINIL